MKVQAVRHRAVNVKQSPFKGLLSELNSQLQDYVEALRSVTPKETTK